MTFNSANNRITTDGFQYDSAGNQTRALGEGGIWLKYEYDAANRIRVVKHDDGSANGVGKQAFMYGSTNARLIDYDYGVGMNKFYASIGAAIGPWCLVATYHRLPKLSTPVRTLTYGKKIVDRVRPQKLNFQKTVSPVPASVPSMRQDAILSRPNLNFC